MSDADDEPPLPTDPDAWCRIVCAGGLAQFPEASIVAAIQASFKRPGVDQKVVNEMAQFVSDRMLSVLRAAVLRKPFRDEGRQIVEDAHGEMLKALFSPNSADGKALSKRFMGTLRDRATDHVRKALKAMKRSPDLEAEVGDMVDPSTELFSEDEQRIHVGLLLAKIGDERKRKAFEMYMNRVPFGGHKGHSIAEELGITAEKASDLVKEAKAQLKKLVRKP